MSTLPTEVYIVTKGEYSDYGIEGVFLDRVLADEFAAQRHASVSVWTIGELDVPMGHRHYRVTMDEEGNTEQFGVDEIAVDEGREKDEFDYEGDEDGPKSKWGYCERWIYTGYRRFYITTDMGEEGAIKIANERRVQLIAANQWPRNGQVVEEVKS